MAEKQLSARVIMKHDSQTSWAANSSFVPKDGEIIVYSFSSGQPPIKIVDGATTVNNLAFVDKVYADHVAATNIHYTVSVDTANELLKFTTAS